MSDDESEPQYEVVFDDEPDKKYTFLPPKDGKAKAIFPNGDTYVGYYKDGKKHGHGCYTFANKAKYEGDYVNNKKHGFGTFTAPDKGRYTGGWLNDKRDGEGTYTYPHGDSYTGGWKNGAKHGAGSYIYANIDSSINGTWSNGQCVDGQWKMHDGSQYVGSFLSNQPAGEGLYVFSSGNYSSGKYVDQKFVDQSFVSPHPDAPMPEPRPTDPFRKACRSIDKAVTKLDHSNNMHQLKAQFQGVPNFRQIGSVAGCGQPSLDGFKEAGEHLKENGMESITWVNLRQDPVVYVNGNPFSPRDRRELDDVFRVGDADAKVLAELEKRLSDNIKFQVRKKGSLHDYYEEVHNLETACFLNEQKTVQVKEMEDIKSLSALYEFLEEEDSGVTPKRIPLTDARSPTYQDFSKLAKVIRELDGGGVVFNDTSGGSRVSTAMVAALLMLGSGSEEEGDEEEEEDAAPKKEEEEKYDPADPNFNKGQFNVVMKLVDLLNGTDPEVARQQKLAEAAAAKEAARLAAEEAKAKAEEEAKAKAEAEGEGENKEGEGDAPDKDGEGDEDNEGDEGDEEKEEEKEEEEEAEKAEEDEGPLEWIKNGSTAKKAVDDAIDKCAQMGNLRTSIIDLRAKSESAGEDEHRVIKRQAANYLERYYNLILFAAYLKDMKDKPQTEPKTPSGEAEDEGDGEDEEQPLSFANWMSKRPNLTENLGTRTRGALAEFKWT